MQNVNVTTAAARPATKKLAAAAVLKQRNEISFHLEDCETIAANPYY